MLACVGSVWWQASVVQRSTFVKTIKKWSFSDNTLVNEFMHPPPNGCLICWPILTVEDKRSKRHEIPKSSVKVSLCGGKHTYAYADENTAECFHPPLDRETPNFIFLIQICVKLPFTLFTECLSKIFIFKSIPVNFDLPDGAEILGILGLSCIFPDLLSLCVFTQHQRAWGSVCDSLWCAGAVTAPVLCRAGSLVQISEHPRIDGSTLLLHCLVIQLHSLLHPLCISCQCKSFTALGTSNPIICDSALIRRQAFQAPKN